MYGAIQSQDFTEMDKLMAEMYPKCLSCGSTVAEIYIGHNNNPDRGIPLGFNRQVVCGNCSYARSPEYNMGRKTKEDTARETD